MWSPFSDPPGDLIDRWEHRDGRGRAPRANGNDIPFSAIPPDLRRGKGVNNMHVYRVMFYLPNARVTSRMLGIVHLICLARHLLRHRFSPPPIMGACMSRLSYAFAGPC